MCVFSFKELNRTIFFSSLDNLSHRHSLYEPPAQVQSRLKRTETIHSSSNNSHSTHVAPKITTHHDRRSLRERNSVFFPHVFLFIMYACVLVSAVQIANRKVDITTVRALQLKVIDRVEHFVITAIHHRHFLARKFFTSSSSSQYYEICSTTTCSSDQYRCLSSS